jgi:hypothetical protein
MAATLTGIVQGMRPVEGIVEQGRNKGEKWAFVSMEITDTRFGKVWSCQLRFDDKQYSDLLSKDLAGHKVKVTIKSQSAGERKLADGRTVMQIRSQITNIRDLGLADEDSEE